MTTFGELNDLVIGAVLTHPFGEGVIERIEQHPEHGITTLTLDGGVILSVPSTNEVPINFDVITEAEGEVLATFRRTVEASHAEGLIDDDDRRRLLSSARTDHLLSWLRSR